MIHRSRRTCALAVVLIVLAACGSDDTDTGTDTDTDTDTNTASGIAADADSGPEADAGTDSDAGTDAEAQNDDETDDAATNVEADVDAAGETAPRSGESIAWEPCGAAECGVVRVPVDRADESADESAGMLDIAVSVHRATGSDDDWLGYLFVNPGGPGGSGIEFAAAAASGVFTAPVLERFDVVGFDPRGVGASDPTFDCGDGSEFLQLRRSISGEVDTDAEIETAGDIAELCGDVMGPAGNRLHSVAVAEDMDVIREELGAEQISYYGASYGSVLGVWYATLFPDAVRAMVVDGADNPISEDTDDVETLVRDQLEEAGAFETQLQLALDACADDSCPIFDGGDPEGVLALASEKIELVEEASPTRSPNAALLGLLTPLYTEARWGELYSAIGALAFDDDPAPLAAIASEQIGDTPGATITSHVNCLDAWVLQPEFIGYDPADLERNAEVSERLREELPLFGPFLVDEFSSCPFSGSIAPEPFTGAFDGSGVPIVVIGNLSDPATPFVESEELVLEQLADGFLVEVDHPSHVVYPGGMNRCVNARVEAMLIDVETPEQQVVRCEPTEAGGGGPMGLDEAGAVIFQACVAYGSEAAPDVDPSSIEAACDDAVGVSIDELGADVVIALASGEAQDRASEIVAIFDEEFAEAGVG